MEVIMIDNKRGLSLGKVTMFAIGATLASGVFSLSGDFAAGGAHPLAVLIGWMIAGLGMLMLTLCFFRLSVIRPQLTSGLYSYAKNGFGEYIGFNSAWGFWLSALLGNLSLITLFFDSLGNFFPIFGNGTNLVSLIAGSAMIWGFGLLVMGGVNEAISINTIVVIAKIIPIAVMIGTIIFSGAFDWNILTGNMTGQGSGFSLMEQVRSTVYTTVWVFVGIEGAVVISGRAKKYIGIRKSYCPGLCMPVCPLCYSFHTEHGSHEDRRTCDPWKSSDGFSSWGSGRSVGKHPCKHRRDNICRRCLVYLYYPMRRQHICACLAALLSQSFCKTKQKRSAGRRRPYNYSGHSDLSDRCLF